jgi:hypothetical protein
MVIFYKIERNRRSTKIMGIPTQKNDLINNIKPQKQIKLIQQKIIQILPEAKNLIIEYDPPEKLHPNDFVELYVNHHIMCLERIKLLMIENMDNSMSCQDKQ